MEYSAEGKGAYKRKSRLGRILMVALPVAAVVAVFSFFAYRAVAERLESLPSARRMRREWAAYDYAAVYETSGRLIAERPFNNAAQTYHGYAAFYLGVAELDTSNAQSYLDESINSLRVAMMGASHSLLPQLEYMLGKAYFYKNTISSYYYSDLAVKYLEAAKTDGFRADDMAEYLGLSYAALGMPMESISAFTEALLVRESDALLLSIAEQYYKAGERAAAEQYLFRVVSGSEDENVILRARLLLGTIYTDEEQYGEAEREFLAAVETDDSADARYGLGVVYERQGDMAKARAEWRRALRLQPNHQGALEKMAG